jgi:GR25 family glycosyltransferase involved in LPS biosynthesis
MERDDSVSKMRADLVGRDLSFVNQLFDSVILINLPSCPDRLDRMHEVLTQHGISYRVFPGVDGRNGDEFPADVWNRDAAVSNRFMPSQRQLRGGEVGCALSHLAVYEAIIEDGLASALILEDDVDVSCVADSILDALQSPPDGWEFLYLGVKNNRGLESWAFRFKRWFVYPIVRRFFHGSRAAKFDGMEMFRISPRSHGAGWFRAGIHHGFHGYAVTRQGAMKLLRYNKPVRLPADLVANELIVSGSLNAFLLGDDLFCQSASRYSTTGNPV